MGSTHSKWILNESYSEEFESTEIKYTWTISMLVKISHAYILTLKNHHQQLIMCGTRPQ
jgi:hypothetical protein